MPVRSGRVEPARPVAPDPPRPAPRTAPARPAPRMAPVRPAQRTVSALRVQEAVQDRPAPRAGPAPVAGRARPARPAGRDSADPALAPDLAASSPPLN